MNILYIYLLIFGCIAYLIITDESIAKSVTLMSQLVKIQFEKKKWMLLHDPRNPIVRWNMWRKAYKLAEELQNEMERKSKTPNNDSTTD